MFSEKITSDFPYQSQYKDVLGAKIHYIEQGSGDPIIFLHGMPTSCYLWRNVIPHLATLGRCIAPDLIGMGKSDKPNIDYTINDHIKYIDAFIEALDLKNVTLVMHGWGSIIGIDYAMRHEKNCKGLVFYEAYLHTLHNEYLSLPYQEQLYEFQERNFDVISNPAGFVEQLMSQLVMRPLAQEEKNFYREPFEAEGAGQPLQEYIQALLPKNSKHLDSLIEDYSKKLSRSSLPKLLLYSVPGFITTIATVMWAKEHLPNLEIAEIGEALHYAQETSPNAMGETISVWLQGVEQSSF